MVVTPNPEQVMMAQKDWRFMQILNEASLALPDGVGLVWASKLLCNRSKKYGAGRKNKGLNPAFGLCVEDSTLSERVTGEVVMNELVRISTERGWKIMMVGGRKHAAQLAVEKLRIRNHELRIKGIDGHGDIRNYSREENEKVVNEINEFRPDILFTAYGAPWQEKWLAENLDKLEIKVGMVVGGALDMMHRV